MFDTESDLNLDGSSLNVGMIAGACGCGLVLCVAAGALLYKRHSASIQVSVTQTVDFDDMKDRFMGMNGTDQAALRFQMLEDFSEANSLVVSPLAAARVLSRSGSFEASPYSVVGETSFFASQDPRLLVELGAASQRDAVM